MINEKIIDTHLHIEAWENEEGSFIDAFEKYKEEKGLLYLNICALPSYNNVGNNIMCLFYKVAHPNTFAHGGVYHIASATEENPEGMDLVTQYKELMEIGFDGIKMLEGKPSYHNTIGKDLNTPSLNRLYDIIEKENTHLIFHVNDPDEFWDKNPPESLRKSGWWYGNGKYSSHDELYRQAEEILKNHPSIKITFAHFYFCGKKPEKLAKLLDTYPNLCVDLTPGGEMYLAFEKRPEYFKEFFKKYSNRVMLGTDATFPSLTYTHSWCIDRLYRYITTNDKMKAFSDEILTGISLDGEEKENILYKNFQRRVAEKPKAVNKEAFRGYIEKYWQFIKVDEREKIKALMEKYL